MTTVLTIQKGLFPIPLFETVHYGSRIETVEVDSIKGGALQQNRTGFCFRRCILTFFGRTVSQIGPNSFELMQTVSSISPKEKDGGL